jgi:hypothetical protein
VLVGVRWSSVIAIMTRRTGHTRSARRLDPRALADRLISPPRYATASGTPPRLRADGRHPAVRGKNVIEENEMRRRTLLLRFDVKSGPGPKPPDSYLATTANSVMAMDTHGGVTSRSVSIR